MFIVRRAFRNCGAMVLPGSIVEPGSIKRFKTRLHNGKIIEIDEQDLDKWDAFFKGRYGTCISRSTKASDVAPTTSTLGVPTSIPMFNDNNTNSEFVVEPEGEPEGEPENEPEDEPEGEPENEPEDEPEDESESDGVKIVKVVSAVITS